MFRFDQPQNQTIVAVYAYGVRLELGVYLSTSWCDTTIADASYHSFLLPSGV